MIPFPKTLEENIVEKPIQKPGVEMMQNVKPCNFALIIMESDTADSDISVSYYSYSVDELYEAVENSSKLVTRRTTVK
ncbi:hypothetical protein QTP88_010368 [Uroleucon formosanum]